MIDMANDLQVLVATIDGEAEGEPLVGQQAVAAAIMNRVALAATHRHFGDGTIRGACLAHAQFDCWSPGPDRDRIMAIDFDRPSPAVQNCIEVARSAIDGTLVDPTGGATHYYADTIEAPTWTQGATPCGRFGSQWFFRDVR